MGVIKRTSVTVILLILLLVKTVHARGTFKIVNNYMFQKGEGGKQVYDGSGDQELNIYEPVFYFDVDLGKKTHIKGHATLDLWSSASEAVFDTSTGASGKPLVLDHNKREESDSSSSNLNKKWQHRLGFNLGVSKEFSTFTFDADIGYSNEYDYTSINGGLALSKSFAEDNLTVALAYHFFFDRVYNFDAVLGSFTGWENKITHAVDLSVTQILSPSDIILLGYTYTYQSGHLAGAQNTVDLMGFRVNESLPAMRNRHAFTLKYVHGFSDIFAAHLDYRFYFDDWGVRSHTVEPSLNLAFGHDAGLVKLFYRFYQQGAVNYYQDSFTSSKTYMTSDSDLASFMAHELGGLVSYEWELKNFFLKSINLTGAASYYTRTNHLDAIVGQLSIGAQF